MSERRGWGPSPGEVALAAALFLVVGWPTIATVRASWSGDAVGGGGLIAAPWSGELGRPLGLALASIRLVAATEALALPLGLPLAFLLFRTDLWGRRPLLGLLVLAAFVPLPLHATAWLGALGNQGRTQALGERPLLVGWTGAAVVHALAALPWVVLLAGVGLRTVERTLEESALLDLPGWLVVARVTLRRGIGAIAAAALAVAVLTAGDMTVTDLLQVRTYAEEAYVQYQLGNGPAAAAAVALPPLAVLGIGIGLGSWLLLRLDPSRMPIAARPRLWRLGRWRVPLGMLVLLIAGNVVALPLYGLIWRAGRVGGVAARGIAASWSLAGLAETLAASWLDVREPLLKSLGWSALGATATVAIAWPLAWLSRRPGPWRPLAAAVVALLLACPGPVVGMAMALASNPGPEDPQASLARWGFELGQLFVRDTMLVVVLVYIARTLPYAVLVLWPAALGVPEPYLESAGLDGYGPVGRARRVAWPLTIGATVAAWGVAFVLALGELPGSNLVEPPGFAKVLATHVWALLHTGVESNLAGVGLIILGVIAAAGALAAAPLVWLYGPGRDRDA